VQMHRRKRLEIVVEKQFARHVTAALQRHREITGYTVLPSLGGSGHHGVRAPDAITDVLDNVLIVVITREEVVPPLLDELMALLEELMALLEELMALLEELMALLEDRVGIVSVSDVEVVRAGHF
jgi:PII-like signaling protein